jgi:cytosine deaminase
VAEGSIKECGLANTNAAVISATIGDVPPQRNGDTMDKFMAIAIEEAYATKAEGGSPFGAALVRNGEVIGRGRNLMIQNNDPLSHGEMEAIKAAGLQESYADTVLYTSAFPCLMCAGAIVRYQIPKVIIGASWEHNAASRDFMQSHGIELVEWRLEACYRIVESA